MHFPNPNISQENLNLDKFLMFLQKNYTLEISYFLEQNLI